MTQTSSLSPSEEAKGLGLRLGKKSQTHSIPKKIQPHLVTIYFLFFKTEFLCVTALAVLESILVDQASLELTEILLPLPPKCWD